MGVVALRDRVSDGVFSWVHRNNLVYNTCWEDPSLDRIALNLSPDDRLLVITSAGCNALDYLLAGCGEVHAVDVNPIQNALLELKRSAILKLDYSDFDQFFGDGRHPQAPRVYQQALRSSLSDSARGYWDKHIYFFNGTGWRDSFYYRGCAGFLAKFLMAHLFFVNALRKPLENLVTASSLEEQSEIYSEQIKPRLWNRWMEWVISRNFTMNFMGVPRAQKKHMTERYPGGVSKYIEDSLEAVLTRLPFKENYFYRLYIEGRYPQSCRPEYLKQENFQCLRERVESLVIHTDTVTNVLRRSPLSFSRFVLLDHMDWMSTHDSEALCDEWNVILDRSSSRARAIYRSAALSVDYLDELPVTFLNEKRILGDLLTQRTDISHALHPLDRVHTYASFYVVDLPEK